MRHPMGGRTALRGLAGLAMGVALAVAVALPASTRGVARVVVAPPLVDPGLVPIARAHRAWLEDRLVAAGIPAGSLSLEGPGARCRAGVVRGAHRLLAKAPEDRPPDAASVAARLQAIRRGDVGLEV